MLKKKSPGSSTGRAKLWRCLGYKFKSYLGHYLNFYERFLSRISFLWKIYMENFYKGLDFYLKYILELKI